MSNQQKLVIVVLVIIGLLYFVGLGAGFGFNDSTQGEPGSSSSTDPPDLVKLLDEWLAPFGDRLDVTASRCLGQPVTQAFSLKPGASECLLLFPAAAKGEKSRKASLRVVGGGSAVPVYFAYKKPDDGADRCPRASPEGLKLIFAELGQPPSEECWSEQKRGKPIRIVALEKAATLKIQCEVCERGGQTVTLKFE